MEGKIYLDGDSSTLMCPSPNRDIECSIQSPVLNIRTTPSARTLNHPGKKQFPGSDLPQITIVQIHLHV